MKNKKLLVLGSMFFALCLTACGENKSVEPEPEPDNTVDVFVLTGQSNMEGSTYFDHNNRWLEKACERLEIDSTPMFSGFDNVYTSYYGYYPYSGSNPTPHASNKTNPMAGEFLNTKVGMGNTDEYMGPEIGIAHVLQERATEDRPVYLIKCAFSGSGFTKTDGANWTKRDEDPTKSLFYLLKTYTYNCLHAIEETGKVPVLKGFLWHQGESDGGDAKYEDYTRTLVGDFREEFKSYAVDEDPDKIAFIDCTIYDGKGTSKMSYGTAANNAKLKIGNESEDDLNFCINANHEEGGLGLEIGDDSKGGYNTYHYNTPDAYKLGKAYGEIILNNNLLRDK